MEANVFLDSLQEADIDFFTGVPDSLLSPFVDIIVSHYGYNKKHIVGVNEGSCVGMAAGYHLATGKIPCVYMQNSGIGNAINPIASLINDKVYGIPVLFVIGYRGEPNVHDEPQHIFQGEITLKQLELLEINTVILDEHITKPELKIILQKFNMIFKLGKSCAIVVKKGALSSSFKANYKNDYSIIREKAIEEIVDCVNTDAIFVSSTGKISRELFEIRDKKNMTHKNDFLTVGSMGHAISIAGTIAAFKPDIKIVCLDGDGAMLMHMGATVTIGALNLKNLIHIVLDNKAHETVGGIQTVSNNTNLMAIAKAGGYDSVCCVDHLEDIKSMMIKALNKKESMFIQIMVALGSRCDLGRPKTTAKENKENFMNNLQGIIK